MQSNKYAVGIDLGGTSVKAGIVSRKGKILKKIKVDTFASEGAEKVISQVKKSIKILLKKSIIKIEGIGIGAPGSVQTKKGTIEHPPNLPGWKSVPLGKIIKKEFGMPVFVENDANAAAIGELIYGAGKKSDNFIMVTLGTGVGGGIIINRRIYRGESGAAGEIGHISINSNGRRCNCGSRGCVEAYLGNNYIIRSIGRKLKSHPESEINNLIEGNLGDLSPKIISEAAKSNDEFAIQVIKELGEDLGAALSSAVNLLDISKVIIGGGVAGFGKLLFETTEETIKLRALAHLRSRVAVKAAKLRNNAGVKGASALVFYDN